MRREGNALSFSTKDSGIKGLQKSPDSMPIQSESISDDIRQETCPGLKGAGPRKWKIVPMWTPSDIDLVRCNNATDIFADNLRWYSNIIVTSDFFMALHLLIFFWFSWGHVLSKNIHRIWIINTEVARITFEVQIWKEVLSRTE